jgi:hypothetical protein
MYHEGGVTLSEYMEQVVNVRPGACDEYFGGGVSKKRVIGKGTPAGGAPAKLLPHGPNMLLMVPTGGKWASYRIGGGLVDIDTKHFRIQQRFHNGKHGYRLDKDDPYDAPWFAVYGQQQSPTRR